MAILHRKQENYIVYCWQVEFDFDLLMVTFSTNDCSHIGRTYRYSGRANSWGSRSFDGLKNKCLHILFCTKIDF